jgi:hypothetical protein
MAMIRNSAGYFATGKHGKTEGKNEEKTGKNAIFPTL